MAGNLCNFSVLTAGFFVYYFVIAVRDERRADGYRDELCRTATRDRRVKQRCKVCGCRAALIMTTLFKG